MMNPQLASIRLALPEDVNQIVALIDGVLQEYGDRICVEPGGAEADLLTIQKSYFDIGGCFWVMEEPSVSTIIATHSAIPVANGVCTFKRLYLASPFRGTDCGPRMMQVAIDWASKAGFQAIEFWSDTRFERAHRFFGRFGFEKTGQTRSMTDSHQPYEEFKFRMRLN